MEFVFRTWGGARKGAGRKPKGDVAGVRHTKREAFRVLRPVHVSMKVTKGIPSLRSRRLFREIRGAISKSVVREKQEQEQEHLHPEKLGMQVTHFSIQSNHLHLVVEAPSKDSLSRGMQGLAIRIAKAINRGLARAGSVFADRYFAHILKTPLEVKRALAYVLENARKHGSMRSGIDPCSSAPWFDGWRRPFDSADIPEASPQPSPVARARSWLLRVGWRKHGLIELGAIAPGR